MSNLQLFLVCALLSPFKQEMVQFQDPRIEVTTRFLNDGNDVEKIDLLLLMGYYVWNTEPGRVVEKGVTWENGRRITSGMSAKEVERILGRPPDDALLGWGPRDDYKHDWEQKAEWGCYHLSITVYFDEDKTVAGSFVEATWVSPWEQVLDLVLDLARHPF
jgi:hypothetical protein